MKNVHEFDGQLKLPYLPDVAIPKRRWVLAELQTSMTHKEAKDMCVIITRQIGKAQDVDPKNNNYESSLLLMYCFLWVPPEAIEEQLLDMFRTGRCIQGQIVRLVQLLLAFASG